MDRLYALRAKGVTWVEQSKILGVSQATIARWWRELGQIEERGEDPRGVIRPPAPPVDGAGPAQALGLDFDIDPARLKTRALRRIVEAIESEGTESLRAAGMGLEWVRKAEAEAGYAAVLADAQHAALASLCMRLGAYLQRRADPVTPVRRAAEDAEAPVEERKAARAWLKAHPEDDELERLYRASAAATASDEDRERLAAWIDARPEIMAEVLRC